ncbi:MAG: glycosyltransferase family 39 protein, partial [Armatimonadota bacterium]|nr:glycosyltransferase family 39 protein [Armatimonadota bacterium]
MTKLVRLYGVPLLLLVATAGSFSLILGNGFINFDDGEYVTENAHVRAGLTWEGLKWAFTTGHAANWHPLTWVSHMLDVEVYGLKPWGHHFTSLLLHIASALLLYGILRRLTGFQWRSALVAGLFALHPLHVESVAWVAERKDVLSAFFWMLTIWAYSYYVESPKIRTYIPVLAFFMLGLISKPMVVTLPFVLLLLDFWPLCRTTFSRNSLCIIPPKKVGYLVLEKIPLFILSAVSCAITYLVQQRGEAVRTLQTVPIADRISNAIFSYVAYIGKMFWPRNLAIFYPYPVEGLPIWEVVWLGLVLICITFVAAYLAWSKPYLIMGWLWYLGTLVPVIGIIQVGSQAMADRYTYIPLIGIFIIIAWGLPDIIGFTLKSKRKGEAIHSFGILPFGAIVSLVVFAICTWIQVGYWRDSVSLFEHTLAATKDNVVAHTSLADALREKGKLQLAAAHYSRALEIYPFDPIAVLNL